MSRKIFISCILLFILFYIILSANYWVIQKHEKQANEIAVLLSPKYFSNKLTGKQYPVSQIIHTNDPLFILLKEKGIINNQSYFSYSSPGCISLITRKSNKISGGFSDILITRNEKGEKFMCGVNTVYSLNNDENAEALNIQAYNLAGHMTLAFVSTLY